MSQNLKIQVWKRISPSGGILMGFLQSSSHSVFFTLLLKAGGHVHGDMVSVCETFVLSIYIYTHIKYLTESFTRTRTIFVFAGWMRAFIGDYGTLLMLVLWSALSFTVPRDIPQGVPRRLELPLPWDSESLYHWTVVKVLLLPSESDIKEY